MARDKAIQTNIDGSDLANYPNKRIRNNDGSSNGTPVNEQVYGDIHEYFAKTMREAGIPYNNIPDNTTNEYQLFEAMVQTPSKNDYVRTAAKTGVDTILIPFKVGNLKEEESLILKANFNHAAALVFIKGTDGTVKNLSIEGNWKAGDFVRIVNYPNQVTISGMYDSRNVPDLVQTITDIKAAFLTYTKIMAVFQADGAMLFWNKPANTIPAGWHEVIDWRGRFPVGMDISQTEFQVLGKMDGEKTHALTVNEMPKHSHTFGTGVEKVGTGNQNGLSRNNGGEFSKPTSETGSGTAHNNLPPYRTVLFIEYTGQ